MVSSMEESVAFSATPSVAFETVCTMLQADSVAVVTAAVTIAVAAQAAVPLLPVVVVANLI